MATSNGAFLHNEASPAPALLPPWLSNSNVTSHGRAPSPSVTLSLSPTVVAPSRASPPIPWLQPDAGPDNSFASNTMPHGSSVPCGEYNVISELVECSRELEQVHRAWAAHKKEASWRLKRVELQLESEKACRKREKMDEFEAKMKALREAQKAALDRIEEEYKEQITGLRRDAETKEHKLADQWSANHMRLSQFIEQMGHGRPRLAEAPNGR